MPWGLIARNLRAHPLRNALTIGSLVIAVFLICTLRSLIVGLNAGVEGASSNRLVVQSAVSLFVDLPLSYQAKIDGGPQLVLGVTGERGEVGGDREDIGEIHRKRIINFRAKGESRKSGKGICRS